MSHRFKRLYPYLWRYRVAIFWGIVCLVATNYLEIRVAMLVGNGIDMLRLPFGPYTDLQRSALTLFAMLVAGLAVGMAVTRFWMRQLIIGASRRIEYDFRNDFFTHLLRLSPSFYDRYRTGDIMSRATSDMDAIRMVIGPSIMYLSNTVTVLPMAIAQMLTISVILTALVWLPLVTLAPLFYYFKSRIHRRFRRVQELMSDLSTYVQETLAGVRVIKIFGREADQSRDFNRVSDQYVASNIGLAKLQAVFIPMLMLIVGMAVLMLIWAGSWLIIHGRLTIGQLTSFFLLLNWSVWPLIALGWVLTQIERGSASMVRVDEIFQQKPDIPPAYDAQMQTTAASSPSIKMMAGEGAGPTVLNGRIEVRDLTFQYPVAEEPALRGLSLTIEAGTTLGLTGPVGCGKSTLARLLARRYNPPRGTIFIDGIDILDWPPHELRRQIGVVDQEPFLFSDTIAANILFGSSNGSADQYARIAQLASDVESFPSGYNTLLGERGINLSGGQRQRAALARALGREPKLLILDDALAAVDTHTEEAILRGLKRLLSERTTLIISHRISTVSLSDRIAFMDRGRIVEQGTHTELMALRGKYFDLAMRQQLAAEIEGTA